MDNYKRVFCSPKAFILVVTLFAILHGANSQNSCVNPKNKSGTCISINKCPELLALLQDRYRTPENTRYLRNSQCGNENNQPKVCCASNTQTCNNPDNAQGTCVTLAQCASLQPLLNLPRPLPQNVLDYLRKSTCQGPDRYSVCCSDQLPSVGRVTPTPAPDVATKRPHPQIDSILPPKSQCGQEVSVDRIIGGEVTAIDQYPWMVLIEYENKNAKRSLSCGASLISSKYVLTAAHCITGTILRQIGNPISVRLGEFDKGNPGMDCVMVAGGEDCTDDPVDIGIEKTIAHPEYKNDKGPKNDIGLIRLVSKAPYTDFIRPICLPERDVTIGLQTNRQTFLTAGWGTTESGKGSDKKLHVSLPFVHLDQCNTAYTQYKAELWDKQLCAGGEAGKDSCRGDSGGPLMHLIGETYNIVGVVSFGPTPCAKSGVPGVYSKVYAYLGWIRGELEP